MAAGSPDRADADSAVIVVLPVPISSLPAGPHDRGVRRGPQGTRISYDENDPRAFPGQSFIRPDEVWTRFERLLGLNGGIFGSESVGRQTGGGRPALHK
jgi:hypothetical protein